VTAPEPEPTHAQILDALRAAGERAATPEQLAEAVRAGLHAAASDPHLWTAVSNAIAQHARSEAGGWLLGGMRKFVSKMIWFVLFGSAVYMVGGWSALAALFKAHPGGQ
jgi:hypothetical protein